MIILIPDDPEPYVHGCLVIWLSTITCIPADHHHSYHDDDQNTIYPWLNMPLDTHRGKDRMKQKGRKTSECVSDHAEVFNELLEFDPIEWFGKAISFLMLGRNMH